jgi:hypothetical protein
MEFTDLNETEDFFYNVQITIDNDNLSKSEIVFICQELPITPGDLNALIERISRYDGPASKLRVIDRELKLTCIVMFK